MTRLTAEEIVNGWRKGRISATLRDQLLRMEGYELAKDHPEDGPVVEFDLDPGEAKPEPWANDMRVKQGKVR